MKLADTLPTPLAVYMTDKESLWRSIVAGSGLCDIPYEQVASWNFGDFIFIPGWKVRF
jgi:hypothetical protein